MLTSETDSLKPCPHMRGLVSARIDEALTGIARWFTDWHLAHCPRCQAAIATLRAMRERFRTLSQPRASEETGLPPERWRAIESAWEQADQTRPRPS